MPLPELDQQAKNLIPENTILLGYRGSVSHGTYKPSDDPDSIDDVDLMGVHIGPIEHYLGFRRKKIETITKFEGKWDLVSYELKHYVSLLKKNNPNVMQLLWLPDEMLLTRTRAGNALIETRMFFLSKKAYHAFKGYAYSQLDKLNKEEFHGYMGDKRKALVKERGYDTKHATHLIRLLTTGIEYLRDAKLVLPRPNADLLLEIKNGQWEYDEVVSYAHELLEELKEAKESSGLPEEPNNTLIETIMMNIAKHHFHNKGLL